jgi:hypothetical protein
MEIMSVKEIQSEEMFRQLLVHFNFAPSEKVSIIWTDEGDMIFNLKPFFSKTIAPEQYATHTARAMAMAYPMYLSYRGVYVIYKGEKC